MSRLAQTFLLSGLAMGCSNGTKTPTPAVSDAAVPSAASARLTHVQIVDRTPPDTKPVVVPAAALRAAVEGALKDAGLPVKREGPSSAWRTSLVVELAYGRITDEGLAKVASAGPIAVLWSVRGQVKAPDRSEGLPLFMKGRVDASWDGEGSLETPLRAALKQASVELAGRVARQLKGFSASTAELLKMLAGDAVQLRRLAAEQLAYRKVSSASPALAKAAAKEPDRETVLRLVGALAEIGDDKAANALMGLVDPKDRELLAAVLDALSVVGGERVEDFLEILAQHDSPMVKGMVEDARARLRRRGAK